MRRVIYLLPLILVAVVVVGLAIPILEKRDPSKLPSALINKPVPSFDLAGLRAGEARFKSDELPKKPILLNVFSSWCAPCRAEIPRLIGLRKEGIAVYGLAYKDDPAATLNFLARFGDPYERIGIDRDGRIGIEFGVYGVPETYVVDGEGKIRLRYAGEVTDHVVETQIRPLLAELSK